MTKVELRDHAKAMLQAILIYGEKVYISGSIGITVLSNDAKNAGRNQLRFFAIDKKNI